MKNALVSLCACLFAMGGMAQVHDADYPTTSFAHIVSDGSYTMIADMNNNRGQGETVEIARDFYLCKYAVTNEQWKEFIADAGLKAPQYWTNGDYPAGKGRHPVLWVSCEEAEAYCQWLGKRYANYEFRLPTEGEWEFAATSGSGSFYPWGDDAGARYADGVLSSRFNFNAVYAAFLLQTPDMLATYNNEKSTRYGESEPVGQIISVSQNGGVTGWVNHNDYTGLVYTDIFTQENNAGGYTCDVSDFAEGASLTGCYNMSGNCWEWTSTVAEAVNGAEKGQMVNVVRGGSWYATAKSCRVSFRGEGRKGSGRYATIGIRVVAEKKNAPPYATYYLGTSAYVMPEGVQGGVITGVDGRQAVVDYRYQAGDVVPAGTALLLNGDVAGFQPSLSSKRPKKPTDNLLRGSDVDETTTGGTYYYKLTYNNQGEHFGFYWGAAGGGAFVNPAHKAYLALSESQAKAFSGFSLGDAVTAVGHVGVSSAPESWYSLQGLRIERPSRKGVYIYKGRKFVIK
ncbi:MAG: formylglycine-generating enzyme family protein [Prevotella sp.]|nr:formylglycine-generating enzyme family protein [Prevotella sp.]